jgi:hypothetical protein
VHAARQTREPTPCFYFGAHLLFFNSKKSDEADCATLGVCVCMCAVGLLMIPRRGAYIYTEPVAQRSIAPGMSGSDTKRWRSRCIAKGDKQRA